MPIKDLTDSVRLPRLGKIHLGTRHPEKGYPMKADHFVFPKEHSDYNKLIEIFGAEAKELRILIPVEDDETWASQYYKAYNQTYGLICKGDGETAMMMIDVKTGELPVGGQAGTVKLQECQCPGAACGYYRVKKCHEVMNLRFIIPEIPGLGVWQIDTGSKNSILNINSCAKIIKRAFGRISMIPLKLTFEPIQVNNPEDMKKQTVYVMNLRTDVTMAQLADAAREQSKTFLLEAPTLEDAFDVEVEKDIDELWGDMQGEKEYINPELEEGLNSEGLTLQPPPAATKSKSSPPNQESSAIPSPNIDLMAIKEQLDTIKENDVVRYQELIVWLSVALNNHVVRWSDAVTQLDRAKLEEFIDLLQ